jgi:hypothetical protein
VRFAFREVSPFADAGTPARRSPTGARRVTLEREVPPASLRNGTPDPGHTRKAAMEPSEIFELIIKADEKLKYATGGKEDVRRAQAIDLLHRARAAAEEIGNAPLMTQVDTRLADLGEPAPGP